jgi:hypothetical protein
LRARSIHRRRSRLWLPSHSAASTTSTSTRSSAPSWRRSVNPSRRSNRRSPPLKPRRRRSAPWPAA